MHPVIACLSLLLTASFVAGQLFRNGKDECFYFNGNEVELNYEDSQKLCKNLGGVLPDLSSNDFRFVIALRKLAKSEVWLGIRRQPDGSYMTESGVPVTNTYADCEVEECALVWGQQIRPRNISGKALQVCKIDKDALPRLRQDLDKMSREVIGLALKEDALRNEQNKLKAETNVIERKVENVMKELNESRSSMPESPIDVWHPLDTLKQLLVAQKEIQKSVLETKDDVSSLKDWKTVIEQNIDEVIAAVEDMPSLQSRTRDVENQILSVVRQSLPHIEANVSLLDSTVQSLAEDLQQIKAAGDKQLDELKSYVDAVRLNTTGLARDSATPEALTNLMNTLREEMRVKKADSDKQISEVREEHESLSVKADQMSKSLDQFGEKMRFMVTEWRSVLDRILQPSSATRLNYRSRVRRIAT